MQDFYFYLTVIIFSVLGLCVGSFLNVVIIRIPNGISLAKPPSHCPKCKSLIKWYDNIPLLSYIILGGKCRSCGQKIPFTYFFIEAINCLLWCLSCIYFYKNGVIFSAIICVILSVLICITLIDEEHLFIPDSLQFVLLILAIINFILNYSNANSYLFGFIIGCGFFLFFYFISFLLFKREGMGFGDVKLMAIAGFLLGAKSVCVSIVIGIIIALIGIIVKRKYIYQKNILPIQENNDEFAFAPYLCLGIAFSLFFGEQIANLYLYFLQI